VQSGANIWGTLRHQMLNKWKNYSQFSFNDLANVRHGKHFFSHNNEQSEKDNVQQGQGEEQEFKCSENSGDDGREV
jgi:hypothetical protein